METRVAKGNDQTGILQNHVHEYQGEINKLKDVIKVKLSERFLFFNFFLLFVLLNPLNPSDAFWRLRYSRVTPFGGLRYRSVNRAITQKPLAL